MGLLHDLVKGLTGHSDSVPALGCTLLLCCWPALLEGVGFRGLGIWIYNPFGSYGLERADDPLPFYPCFRVSRDHAMAHRVHVVGQPDHDITLTLIEPSDSSS